MNEDTNFLQMKIKSLKIYFFLKIFSLNKIIFNKIIKYHKLK